MKIAPLVNRDAGFIHEGRLLSTKAATVPPVAPRLQNIHAGTKAKTLLSAIDAVAAQNPEGTPIAFDAFDAAEIMGTTREEASHMVQSLKSAGLLREERDYGLGWVMGYTLDGAAKRP